MPASLRAEASRLMRRLREKIEPDPSAPAYIQTVWGVGYKFEPAT